MVEEVVEARIHDHPTEMEEVEVEQLLQSWVAAAAAVVVE